MLATELNNNERREIARRHFESAEVWLRKIIDYFFLKKFGPDYFSHILPDGSSLIKNDIRKNVYDRRINEPTRFSRDIDATTFGEAIQIVTNPHKFNTIFKPALEAAYPNGAPEAKTFLEALKKIRDTIHHLGPCSARDLEKAVCYSNDFIDSAKTYFASIQMDRLYNVPKITHFVDSLGNESHMENVPHDVNARIIDWRRQGRGDLRPGDSLKVEIEVDQSFDRKNYTISWHLGRRGVINDNSGSIFIEIEVGDVATQFEFRVTVTSRLDWHEFGLCDDSLSVIYRVLPPP